MGELIAQIMASHVANQSAALTRLKAINQRAEYDIYSAATSTRKTSIVCTIGPKTKPLERLQELRAAGMNIVRMNFSHGSYEYHGSVVANARALEEACSAQASAPIAVALDTKGPEIRSGILEGADDVELVAGAAVTVTTDVAFKEKCNGTLIFVDFAKLPEVVEIGSSIFIDDGLIALTVKAIDGGNVITEVANGGMLGSRKGVNLPNVDTGLPSLSEKDTADLRWGVQAGVDIVFASFIRSAGDVANYREVLGKDGQHIKIVAKIENHEGVRNLDSILEAADGIMVARGDLGIEIPAEKVFLAQKMMVAKCNLAAKPVICATQMLESMTTNPRPTRAEVSDVANAVLDGSDCVMLSGETAKGDFPIESVSMMASICQEAEAAFPSITFMNELKANTLDKSMTGGVDSTIAMAAADTALAAGCAAIIVLSYSGNSARLIAQFRPRCPIVVVSRNRHACRICHLYSGCYPLFYNEPEPEADNNVAWELDVKARFEWALAQVKQRGFVNAGDRVVTTSGQAPRSVDQIGLSQIQVITCP